MQSSLATSFEQAIQDVSSLMSAAFDKEGINDSAHYLAFSGLSDGEAIVR